MSFNYKIHFAKVEMNAEDTSLITRLCNRLNVILKYTIENQAIPNSLSLFF